MRGSGRTGEPFGQRLSLVAVPADGTPAATLACPLQMCIATDCLCYGAGCDWCAYGTDVA